MDKITRGYQSLEGVESEPKEGRNTKMTDKVMENNRVAIIGEVVSDFEFSHEVFGEGFYMLEVSVNRLSNQPDIIPLMVSERLVDVTKDYKGQIIEVNGQFRSYNRHEGSRNRLVLSIFVREWEILEDGTDSGKTNQIYLEGYICKPPIYRKTPLGREIADLLVAVNRPYGKSDYIPSHGAEMPDMRQTLKWEARSSSGEECRAENISRKQRKQREKSVSLMKYLLVS